MIKVLVAEDELPLLRGIANMIEELDSDFKVVMRAKNGREAMQFIGRETVDIVFTDINMPMIDGLELLEYLAENNPEIVTVVISGYDEFSYVQKAIRYRARNYLLKPVDRKELKQQLVDIKAEIKVHSYKEQEEFLTQLLFGSETPRKVSFSGHLYPLCLCAGACTYYNGTESPSINEFWGEVSVRTLLCDIRGNKEGVFCYLGRYANEYIVLLEEQDGSGLAAIAEELLFRLPKEVPVTIIYEKQVVPVYDLKKVIYSFYERIRVEGCYGKNNIINDETIREEYGFTGIEENALKFSIKKENLEDVKKLLEDIQKKMEQNSVSQKNMEQLMHRLVTIMNPSQRGSEQEEAMREDTMELLRESFFLEQFFENYYLLWKETYFGLKLENGKELMQEVDEYIKEHIKEPITTKHLSHKFGLVSPYLSKLFKEYKGETPIQYIQNIRIQCAKEMLVGYPDMLAKDVAEMIGYGNPLYFSKIFKKKVGLYPSEYRDRKKEKQE